MLSIVKRNSTYYFRHWVPSDIQKHFPSIQIMVSLKTGRYADAKRLAYGKLAALEKVFMTIRAGVLTDDDITVLVEKYKREQLDKQDMYLEYMQGQGGGQVRAARKELTDHYHSEAVTAKNILLDDMGMEEQTVHVAHSLLKVRGEDGIGIADYSPDFKRLCRAVSLVNKEVLETLIQRNETGDSDYDRHERAKPKSKTLKELIEIYWKEKEAGWTDPQSTKAIHKRILHILGVCRP